MQWQQWTLPSKASYVGCVLGIISFVAWLVSIVPWKASPEPATKSTNTAQIQASPTPPPAPPAEEKQQPISAAKKKPSHAATPQKQAPSVSIQQTNPVNSPAIVGDHVTVNYNGPPEPFVLTIQQQESMRAVLSEQPGEDINLFCIGRGCDSMDSISPAFDSAQWRVYGTHIGQYMSMGLPGPDISRGVYVVDTGAPTEARAVLEKALHTVGIIFKLADYMPSRRGPSAKLALIIGNP